MKLNTAKYSGIQFKNSNVTNFCIPARLQFIIEDANGFMQMFTSDIKPTETVRATLLYNPCSKIAQLNIFLGFFSPVKKFILMKICVIR